MQQTQQPQPAEQQPETASPPQSDFPSNLTDQQLVKRACEGCRHKHRACDGKRPCRTCRIERMPCKEASTNRPFRSHQPFFHNLDRRAGVTQPPPSSAQFFEFSVAPKRMARDQARAAANAAAAAAATPATAASAGHLAVSIRPPTAAPASFSFSAAPAPVNAVSHASFFINSYPATDAPRKRSLPDDSTSWSSATTLLTQHAPTSSVSSVKLFSAPLEPGGSMPAFGTHAYPGHSHSGPSYRPGSSPNLGTSVPRGAGFVPFGHPSAGAFVSYSAAAHPVPASAPLPISVPIASYPVTQAQMGAFILRGAAQQQQFSLQRAHSPMRKPGIAITELLGREQDPLEQS
jgi:hypothetical protein